MTSSVAVISCLLAVWLPLTTAYSTGPPVGIITDLCDSMSPQHDAAPQTEGYPFEIVTSGICYKAGMSIPVVVRVNASQLEPFAQPYFEGFFVMAREVTSGTTLVTTTNVGTFEVPMPNNITTTYPCYNNQDSSVGHKKATHWPCTRFMWKAPTGFTANITLQGTIVRRQETYWKDVRSVSLMYDANCAMPDQMLKCEAGILGEDDSGEKDETASGSDVIRVTAFTCIWIVLMTLLM